MAPPSGKKNPPGKLMVLLGSAMSFFARPHYTSDVTNFLNQLKADNPELEQSQRRGRALLWDKQIDREFKTQADSAVVPQKSYVYQTKTDPS
jgi:hypothetical protein